MTDSTFFGNSANSYGGAIYNLGTVTVTNSTFSRNSATEGGAISGGGFLQNTIVANSTRGANCDQGTFTDGGHNMRWPPRDTSCVGYFGDPKLLHLKDNGGPTKTLALRPGSAAINAGDNAICAVAPVNGVDQRGFARPGVGSTNCSIGAYEFNAQ